MRNTYWNDDEVPLRVCLWKWSEKRIGNIDCKPPWNRGGMGGRRDRSWARLEKQTWRPSEESGECVEPHRTLWNASKKEKKRWKKEVRHEWRPLLVVVVPVCVLLYRASIPPPPPSHHLRHPLLILDTGTLVWKW